MNTSNSKALYRSVLMFSIVMASAMVLAVLSGAGQIPDDNVWRGRAVL